MAGLNNLISNTAQQTTTLPSWFDTAQQNVVTQAGQAASAAPTPANTVAQGAVNALSGPTNAFTQAGGTLQNIASGAANPWITNQQTGQVTPDTSTALGGLFQAQNQQLQQLMPNVTAQPTAGAISSGNFGSLRGQTAVNKAMGDAQAQLAAQQMQAALQNQATGVNAASAAGNVAQQGINNQLTVGQYQQAAPFTNVSNYGKILGGIQAPTTVQNQTQLSPLNQYAGLYSMLAGSGGNTGLLNKVFGSSSTPGSLASIPGLSSLGNLFSGMFSGSSGGQQIGTDQATKDFLAENPGATPRDEDGNLMPGWESNSDGSVSWTGDTSGGGTDYTNPGGGDTFDWFDTESYD